jgi:hypothetical protein
MKLLFLILPISLFISCDPSKDIYQTGTVLINAQVINPKSTINLGDSVAFYFEVPDTVLLNGARIKVSAVNNDGGTIGLSPYKIISSNIGGSSNNPISRTCAVYANPGLLTTNETLVFQKQNNGKLLAKYYMIPNAKGVYYMLQMSASPKFVH